MLRKKAVRSRALIALAGEVALETVKHHDRGIVRESADLLYHLVALWHHADADFEHSAYVMLIDKRGIHRVGIPFETAHPGFARRRSETAAHRALTEHRHAYRCFA